MSTRPRTPIVTRLYQLYLLDQDKTTFLHKVTERYSIATLERLATSGNRASRRAAVLALGHLAEYPSNQIVGRALVDPDRGVRMLADCAIRLLWCRWGNLTQRRLLKSVMRMNGAGKHEEAVSRSSELLAAAPKFAECWNQRAIAHFGLGRFAEAIRDCRHALKLNKYHFGAAAGMGQCYMKLNDHQAALEAFRRALALNPSLEGVRSQVTYLERALKRQ